MSPGATLLGKSRDDAAEQLGVGVKTAEACETIFTTPGVPNTDRRQLSPQEIALAFTRLKQIPREQGGAKAKRGRPEKVSPGDTILGKSRDDAAEQPPKILRRRFAFEHNDLTRVITNPATRVIKKTSTEVRLDVSF